MSNKSLYDELLALDKKQRQDIKRVLSLDVSQALRILKDGRRLATSTKAKYGYYLSKFRPTTTNKKEFVDKTIVKYNDTSFFKDYMIRNKLEEF